MLKDKADIVVGGLKLNGIEMEGLSALEINSIANIVSDRMERLSKEYNIVDSRKLAIMAALEFAADLQRIQAAAMNVESVSETKLENMILALEKAMEASKTAKPAAK